MFDTGNSKAICFSFQNYVKIALNKKEEMFRTGNTIEMDNRLVIPSSIIVTKSLLVIKKTLIVNRNERRKSQKNDEKKGGGILDLI